MSKYKIFASQGSFSANQLKAPDESRKILEAAERRVRGMNTAQAFLEKNNQLYLRAQQQAQDIELKNREDNFKFETENRKQYQEALRKNTETTIENDRIQASKTEKLYKDLSSFSKTAFQLYGTFEKERQKTRQAFFTQEVIKSGLDYNQLKQLTSIDQNLTDSAFRQTEFIQDLINSGASEEQITVLGNMWRRNAPNVYLNTQAAYQRSFANFAAGADQAIAELGPDANLDQKKARLQTYVSEFMINQLPGARPEMLESSGLLRSITSFNNQLISGYSRQEASKREKEVLSSFKTNIQTAFVKDGIEGVMRQIQENPSGWKRETFVEWIKDSLSSSGPYAMTAEQAQAILDYGITVGDKRVKFGEQFADANAEISQALRSQKRRDAADTALAREQERAENEAQLAKIFDSYAADGDGRIDALEFETLRETAISMGLQDSKIMEFAQLNSVNARTDRAIETYMMEKARNLTLKVDDVMGVKMGANLRNKLLNIARQQQETRQSPIYKAHIQSIEAAVSQHPQIKAAPITGSANYSVVLMKDRYVQQYKQNLQRLDPEQALSLTLQQIKTMQATPGAITKEGTYKAIEDRIKASSQGANVSLNRVNSILAAMGTKVFDTDPEWAVGVVGEEVFNNFYSTVQAGGQPPELLKTLAARRGVDPFTLINHLAKGAKKPPIKPLDNQLKELKDNLPPITRRLYDEYRTNERVTRANAVVSNASSQMPKRASFSGNEDYLKFRRAIIKQESGGNYQIVNPDSGAIGIGQVMPENVGPWTERYLGKRLTPEQFRYNNAAQDAVVNGRFKDMLADQAKAGYSGEEMVRRAAAVWYSGRADLWNYNKPEYYNGRRYPSIAEYTKSIWNSFQRQ